MNLRVASASAVAVLLGGCATTPPPAAAPLSAEAGATAFQARSLDDPGLRRFLADNLGREPSNPWDFDALCWVAFYYHPSLALARAQWATTRAAQQTAALRPNPTVSLVPGYNTTRQPGVSPWFPAINFDFLLLNADKRNAQQAIARADAEAARLGVVTAAWQVRTELRRAWLEWQSSANRLANLRQQAELQKKLLTLTEQRLTAGRISVAEVSTVRLAWLKAESAVADASAQADLARPHLAAALAVPVAAITPITLAPPTASPALTPEALAAARQQSLQSRPDLLAALAHYESVQAALSLEVAKQRPDIHLGPGYQWDQGANKWSLSLTFELPLFHRNEAAIAESVARRAEAAAQFNLAQIQAIAALDNAAAAQRTAANQADHARQLVAEVRAQADRVQQRFDRGGADQFERTSAQLELTAAELAGLDASAALALASGQLEDALQVPFQNLAALTPSP